MKKQLNLEKIKEALSRRNYRFEIFSLYDDMKCKLRDNTIPYEYVPIKIVASFEDFFREKYQEIIDMPHFRKGLKSVNALKNVIFDYDILGAFQDIEITLGDYLSYMIPCSKFEDINNALSELLNINFAEKIKELNDNSPDLLNSINEIFKLRHIFCHEIPHAVEMDYYNTVKLIDDAKIFLTSAENVLSNIIYPVAHTAEEMRKEANKMLDAAENELNSLIQRIQSEDTYGVFNFDFLTAWRQYRETRASLYSTIAGDGSMNPIAYVVSKESTTKALIKELKDDFRFLLR